MTTPSPIPTPNIPIGDLSSLAQALGLDPSALPTATVGASRAMVYMGMTDPGQEFIDTYGTVNPLTGRPLGQSLTQIEAPAPKLMSAEEAKLSILGWSEAELEAFTDRAVAAGLLDESPTRDEAEQLWSSLVDKASKYHAFGKQVTPQDMLDIYAVPPDKLASLNKSVTRQVRVVDQAQARSVLTSVMAQELGRRPTEIEVDDFQAELNAAQANAPLVTTTTRTGDTTNVTTSGGVDEDDFAGTYARGGKPELNSEYGAYQAATTYYEALLQAIRGPVGM